jgi:hypothetical protein
MQLLAEHREGSTFEPYAGIVKEGGTPKAKQIKPGIPPKNGPLKDLELRHRDPPNG